MPGICLDISYFTIMHGGITFLTCWSGSCIFLAASMAMLPHCFFTLLSRYKWLNCTTDVSQLQSPWYSLILDLQLLLFCYYFIVLEGIIQDYVKDIIRYVTVAKLKLLNNATELVLGKTRWCVNEWAKCCAMNITNITICLTYVTCFVCV